jgi:hypothetical protein
MFVVSRNACLLDLDWRTGPFHDGERHGMAKRASCSLINAMSDGVQQYRHCHFLFRMRSDTRSSRVSNIRFGIRRTLGEDLSVSVSYDVQRRH